MLCSSTADVPLGEWIHGAEAWLLRPPARFGLLHNEWANVFPVQSSQLAPHPGLCSVLYTNPRNRAHIDYFNKTVKTVRVLVGLGGMGMGMDLCYAPAKQEPRKSQSQDCRPSLYAGAVHCSGGPGA